MRASRLRLIPVYVGVVAGVAILPVSAIAEPSAPAAATVAHAAASVVRDPQVVTDEPSATPPLWLLLLLGPVLVGGVVGVGVTLRRLR